MILSKIGKALRFSRFSLTVDVEARVIRFNIPEHLINHRTSVDPHLNLALRQKNGISLKNSLYSIKTIGTLVVMKPSDRWLDSTRPVYYIYVGFSADSCFYFINIYLS